MSTNDETLRQANTATIESWRDHLDISVPIVVELGRTKLTASAILELENHSIVQLPRSTGEGVDVLAGQQLLGRGEIVMIEDRTGVRINDIHEEAN